MVGTPGTPPGRVVEVPVTPAVGIFVGSPVEPSGTVLVPGKTLLGKELDGKPGEDGLTELVGIEVDVPLTPGLGLSIGDPPEKSPG